MVMSKMPAGRRAVSTIASSFRSAFHGGTTPLATKGPYASKLETRKVLQFAGPDVLNFLQGLITNDVSKFKRELTATPTVNAAMMYHAPLYAAMLNAQGRFLYDLFLYKPNVEVDKLDRSGSGPGKGEEDAPVLLADVDAGVADELVAYLKKHILRKKVSVHDISETHAVWQYYGGVLAAEPSSTIESEAGSIGWAAGKDEAALSSVLTSGSDQSRWFKDPRLSTLGLRGLFSSRPPLIESGMEVDEDYYLLWRLEQGVAEGSVEIPKGEAIPLEYNLAGLNAISFEKGCYVGQELVARTHHRGVIRKRLVPLHFLQSNGEEAQQSVTPGAEVVDKKSGKKVGKVTTVLGPRGMGLIRLDSVNADELHIDNNHDVHVKAERPKWWASSWGREDEPQAASN